MVTDGELRRDNMVDHFAVRLAGVEIDRRQKAYYFDFYEAVAAPSRCRRRRSG